MKFQLLILAFLAGAACAKPLKDVEESPKTLAKATASDRATSDLGPQTENLDVGPGPGGDGGMADHSATLRDLKKSFKSEIVPYGPLRGPDDPADRNVRDVSDNQQNCLEGNGASYRGTVSVTETGKTCQRWDSQTPHGHVYIPVNYPSAGLEHNYCRNPDDWTGVWCYTTDNSTRWERCDVPVCVGHICFVSKATVTTRRTCFCVLSTCKNVGNRTASVRAYERATYGLRESNFTFLTCNCCTDSARSTCVPRTLTCSMTTHNTRAPYQVLRTCNARATHLISTVYKDNLTGDCQLVSKMPRKAQKKTTRQDPKKRAAEDTRAASDDEVNRRCTHLQRASE
ncbi:hypothetical protein Bbelb_028200 [Branchiostoma belcheri]|nr:hypothetical protein Bbelb_028200 [Branchiostoma belcheri]